MGILEEVEMQNTINFLRQQLAAAHKEVGEAKVREIKLLWELAAANERALILALKVKEIRYGQV